MKIEKIKEGKTVSYKARKHEGRGKVVELYERANGHWVIVHDKARNVSVTLRPSQIS